MKSLFSSKFPIISESDFEFLKLDRNNVSKAPTVSEWNTAHLKALMGQSKKLYCRLKYINSEALKIDNNIIDEEDLELQEAVLPSTPTSIRRAIPASTSTSPHPSTSTAVLPSTSINSPAASTSSLDYESLLNSTNSLVNELLDKNHVPQFSFLAETLAFLNSKVEQESFVRLSVDRSFLFDDAMAFYKGQNFDPKKVLKIRYQNEPAIDTGGVQRQFFTDLFELLENGTNGLPPLFVGKPGHKLPTSDPSIAGSDLMTTVGKIIAHCIVQNGYSFGNFAPSVYQYVVHGDITKAVPYITIEDISSPTVKQCVQMVKLHFLFI